MLAISPPFFSFPLEDLRIHEQNVFYPGETDTSESLLNSPTFEQQGGQNHESQQFSLVYDQSKTVKKLNHNASERERRKRINDLYSSLRSLLPPAYQEKKSSIPATVSRVLKYMPELQKEVESLIQKKECLTRRISEQQNSFPFRNQRNSNSPTQILPSSTISASRLSDSELMVQISTLKFSMCSYADVLSSLEQDGLFLLNSSCFESFGERVFHTLHLEAQGARMMDLEGLRKKLLSLYIQSS